MRVYMNFNTIFVITSYKKIMTQTFKILYFYVYELKCFLFMVHSFQ
jgi:hypothetical protein